MDESPAPLLRAVDCGSSHEFGRHGLAYIEIAMHADADGDVAHSFLRIETSGDFY